MARKRLDVATLQAEYKRTAKKLDERLRTVERFAGYNKGYEDIKKYAYHSAQRLYKDWYGVKGDTKGIKPRFDKKAPEDARTLKQRIKKMNELLDMPTMYIRKHKDQSGKAQPGYSDLAQRNVERLESRYGLKISWKDFSTFYEKLKNQGLLDMLGSDMLFMLIGYFGKNRARKELLKELEELNRPQDVDDVSDEYLKKVNAKLREIDDEFLRDEVRDLLKTGKLNLSDLV